MLTGKLKKCHPNDCGLVFRLYQIDCWHRFGSHEAGALILTIFPGTAGGKRFNSRAGPVTPMNSVSRWGSRSNARTGSESARPPKPRLL